MKIRVRKQSDIFDEPIGFAEINTLEELQDLVQRELLDSIRQRKGFYRNWTDEDVEDLDIEEEGYDALICFNGYHDVPDLVIRDDYIE